MIQSGGPGPENAKAPSQYTVVELKSIEELKRAQQQQQQHQHQLLTRTGSAPLPTNDGMVSAWWGLGLQCCHEQSLAASNFI